MLLSRKTHNMTYPGEREKTQVCHHSSRVFHWRRRGNDLLILLNVLIKSRLKRSYPAHYLI